MLVAWAGDALGLDALGQATLVCSELVSAVLHGEGRTRLQLDLDEHRLLIG